MATWSTLDLLDANVGDDTPECEDSDRLVDRKDSNEPSRITERHGATARELFVVQGETTGVSRARAVKKQRRPASASASRSKVAGGGNQATADDDSARRERPTRQNTHEEEVHLLRKQLEQCRRELAHCREEREELQVAFRRLDREITNGYNLTERKEKELKIAELLTKNQKLSQMLERELKNQEALRTANADLQNQIERQEKQTTLLNQVLTSVESKHATLVEVHSQLTATYSAAQHHLADLQTRLHQWEAKEIESTHQRRDDHEEKLRLWELRCTELQRKLEDRNAMLRAEQDKAKLLELTCEKMLEERASLEREVATVHDKLIHMSGVMKAMEVTVEASSSAGASSSSLLERIKLRVRALEEEMLGKNRLISDLKDAVNSLLSSESELTRPHKGLKRRLAGTGNQAKASSRAIVLVERLRKAEESRDHKTRCLNILLAVLPQLLQQLDALQDKFHATVESNTILAGAIEQLQENVEEDSPACRQSAIALAREGYVLSGPYQPELLMGFTVSRALSEVAPPPPRKHAKFMPFHVRSRVSISDPAAGQGELLIAADADDASGVTFLNRSKINAYLHFVQGNAAKAKCKQLLVKKIADLLSTQRDLMHVHSTESGYYKASMAKLEAEVRQRAKKESEMQAQMEQLRCITDTTSEGGALRRKKMLLKLLEALIGDSRLSGSTTFVTQTQADLGSDILIDGGSGSSSTGCHQAGRTVDLSECGVGDEDLESLLIKIAVNLAPINELDLRENWISDAGCASIASFLETYPRSLCVLNLRGNTTITPDGVNRLRSGLLKNSRVCRVDYDCSRHALKAIGVDQEYDTAGRTQAMLTVFLPEGDSGDAPSGDNNQDHSVETLIQRLESMGFAASASNLTRAETVYRTARVSTATKTRSSGPARRALLRSSTTTSARSAPSKSMSQQEKKFRALESALHRSELTHTASRSTPRGITLSQMQHLLKRPAASVASRATASAPLVSSQRLAKLHFAQSHLATIRGLGKK